MADAATLGREEVLERVRTRILAAAGASLSPADAEDVAQEALLLLNTSYASLATVEELVTIGARIVAARRRGLEEALSHDPKNFLAGDATDSLPEAERSERLRAALEDQELFDALVDEEALREPPTVWERLRAWFERPATLLDLGAIMVLAVAALAGYALLAPPTSPDAQSREAARPIGTSLSPHHVAWLLGLPERQIVPAGIEVRGRANAVFAPGETLQLQVSLRAPARIALLSEPVAGPPSQAWPGLGQPPALVPPRRSGGPAILPVVVEAPPGEGSHRLRLVVAPADLDLGALAPEALAGVAGRLTLVDLRYQVSRRW